MEALVTFFAANRANPRLQQLEDIASRGVLLMVAGCLLFSIMGALVKLLGQRLGSFQIAFFRCFFGFIAILPFVLLKPGRQAFRTTHFRGHFLRGAIGVAALVAGFYATTRLPLTDSTAISFTAPLFMILTAIFLLGEKVRWRRGLATVAGFIGVLVMVRPNRGTLDLGAMVGLFAAFLGALSTTLIKRLSATEEALTILVYFGLFSSILTAIPAYFVWRPPTGDELALLAFVGALGAVGQFCQVRAFAAGELMAVAPNRLQPPSLRRDPGLPALCRIAGQIHLDGRSDNRRIDALYRLSRNASVAYAPCRARGTADRCAPGDAVWGRRCGATSCGRVRQ